MYVDGNYPVLPPNSMYHSIITPNLFADTTTYVLLQGRVPGFTLPLLAITFLKELDGCSYPGTPAGITETRGPFNGQKKKEGRS